MAAQTGHLIAQLFGLLNFLSQALPLMLQLGGRLTRKVFDDQPEVNLLHSHPEQSSYLLPEVQALRPEMPIVAVVPVISGDMARFVVGYYLKSLDDLGETIDNLGFSDAFQAIAARAAELGELSKSRVVAAL